MRYSLQGKSAYRSLQAESLEPRRLLAADVAGPYAEFASMVTDFNKRSIKAYANWSVPFNDSQYFLLSSEGGYNELWKTDGTTAGTELVTKVSRHPIDTRNALDCTCYDATQVIDGQLYFVVLTGTVPLVNQFSGEATTELWQTDGTAAGTKKVRDLDIEEPVHPRIVQFDLFDDYGEIGVISYIFFDNPPFQSSEIIGYTYDGLYSPTMIHIRRKDLVQRDGATFFLAFEIDPNSTGTLFAFAGLYKADHSSKQIQLVKELENRSCPDRCAFGDSGSELFQDWDNATLEEIDNRIVIRSSDGRFVYHSDGTATGTILVENGPPQDRNQLPSSFELDQPLVTLGVLSDGERLTYNGDVIAREGNTIFDIPNITDSHNPGGLFVASDGTNDIGVAYAAASPWGSRRVFHLSDGTEAGSKPINQEEYRSLFATVTDTATANRIASLADLPQHYEVRGTTILDDTLFVHMAVNPSVGDATTEHEIWAISSDNDILWREQIQERIHAPAGQTSTLIPWDGHIYFAIGGRHTGTLLKKFDVSDRSLRTVFNGGGNSAPTPRLDIATTSEHLYFSSFYKSDQIWVIDAGSDTPRRLDAASSSFVTGWVWHSPGGIYESGNSIGAEVATWQDRLFFGRQADDGVQLWSSDGSEDGTELALDLGPTTTMPMGLTVWDDKLFFAADDGIHGNELWVIDLAAHMAAANEAAKADINGDMVIDFADFLILSANYGNETDQGKVAGDLDGNQLVDFADFLLLAEYFGRSVV